LFIQDFNPKSGPTSGKSKIKVVGMGFKQFKNDDGSKRHQTLYARFRDSATGELIGNYSETFNIQEEEFSWKTPPADSDTKAILEYSYNLQDWHPIYD
jgi:hypothetical protein